MKQTIEPNTALILVDIQLGFTNSKLWGNGRNNPDAEQNAAKLLWAWRKAGRPVFHVKHNSLNLNSPLHPSHQGNAIQDVVKPLVDEVVIGKSVNSGFIGTNLQALLDQQGIRSVVICGLTTDQCVSTTTRMAANLAYTTYLVADACATFAKIGFDGEEYSADLLHRANIASIKDEFATIVNTADLLEI